MIKKIVPLKIKQKLKSILDFRPNYICPFCNTKTKEFFEIGSSLPVLKSKQIIGGGLRNGGCFHCRSTDRERLVYIYLKEKIEIFKKNKFKNILHFAPEKLISEKLREFGFENYICGDLFTEGYQYPDYVKNINVLDIPYPNESFELVICNHVLEHIPNDLDAMKEIYRVLNKKGMAILQVPISKNTNETFEDLSVIDPKQREIVFGQFDHVRIYGQDYAKRLESVGFKVSRLNLSQEFKKFGLNPEEDIFVVFKE